MNKKRIIGIVIFIVLILGIVLFKQFGSNISDIGLTTIYVATGGGKENFIEDEEILDILRKEYKINVVFDE